MPLFQIVAATCQMIWHYVSSQRELARMDPQEREALLAETGNNFNGYPVE